MALTDNVIAAWRMEENAASTAVEDSAGANEGTASTNTSNLTDTGKLGNCFNFASANSEYVNCGDMEIFNKTNYTISLWVKGAAQSKVIFGEGNNVAPNNNRPLYKIMTTAGGKITVQLLELAGIRLNYTSTATALDNNWHMVTFGMQGTAWKLWIDNNLDGSGTITKNTAASYNTTIASIQDYTMGDYFDGYIDDIVVWDRLLEATEVTTSLWNSGAGFAYPFSTDVTVSPSALTLSTTSNSPLYLIDITAGAMSLSLNLKTPTVILPTPPRYDKDIIGTPNAHTTAQDIQNSTKQFLKPQRSFIFSGSFRGS